MKQKLVLLIALSLLVPLHVSGNPGGVGNSSKTCNVEELCHVMPIRMLPPAYNSVCNHLNSLGRSN